MKEIIAICNPENTCMNCLSEGKAKTIKIGGLGYGGKFDGWTTKINLCEECYGKTNQNWWDLKILTEDKYLERYEYEKEILNYISSMPLEGRELFYNRFASGWNTHYIEPQDWINYKLNILPHEKRTEYGLRSPQKHHIYIRACLKSIKNEPNEG